MVTDSKGASVKKTIKVVVEDTKVAPIKPTEPQKPGNGNQSGGSTTQKPNSQIPKTGDASALGVFASLLAGASGMGIFSIRKRKNKQNKQNR